MYVSVVRIFFPGHYSKLLTHVFMNQILKLHYSNNVSLENIICYKALVTLKELLIKLKCL